MTELVAGYNGLVIESPLGLELAHAGNIEERAKIYARQHDDVFGSECPLMRGITLFAVDMYGWPGVWTMRLPIPEHIVNEMTPDEVESALWTEYEWFGL